MGVNIRKLNQSLEVTLLNDTNPYSSAAKIFDCAKKVDYYIKFIRKGKSYKYNQYDLGALFGRDRVFASIFFERQFAEISVCKKYVPELIAYSAAEHILVYKNCDINQRKLSDLIAIGQGSGWVKLLIKLTEDFSTSKTIGTPPKELGNNKVLKLKTDLQIIKPLSYMFNKKLVGDLNAKTGRSVYLNHGDLQPKNILISGKKITVIDYEEGFYGPLGWDLGFLWGNIFVLAASNETLFKKLGKVWMNYCVGRSESKQRYNLLLFTLTTLLFRLHVFPLTRLSKEETRMIQNFAEVIKGNLVSQENL